MRIGKFRFINCQLHELILNAPMRCHIDLVQWQCLPKHLRHIQCTLLTHQFERAGMGIGFNDAADIRKPGQLTQGLNPQALELRFDAVILRLCGRPSPFQG